MSMITKNMIGADHSLSWADSAALNTHKTFDITCPAVVGKYYALDIINPSVVTGLNIEVANLQESLGGFTQRVRLATFNSAKSIATLLENCEDAWNEGSITGVTATADNTSGYFQVGSNSAKFAVAANAAAGILGYETISVANITSATHVRLWARSSVAVAAGGLQLLLDDTALCASPLETIDLPAIPTTFGTEPLFVALANPASDLSLVSIGIKQPTDLGAFNLWIDDVQAIEMSMDTRIIQGAFQGGDLRITVDNDTALSTVNAFTAYFRLREVE